jgi:hypothetical protein
MARKTTSTSGMSRASRGIKGGGKTPVKGIKRGGSDYTTTRNATKSAMGLNPSGASFRAKPPSGAGLVKKGNGSKNGSVSYRPGLS